LEKGSRILELYPKGTIMGLLHVTSL